jgi:hypothetical protein
MPTIGPNNARRGRIGGLVASGRWAEGGHNEAPERQEATVDDSGGRRWLGWETALGGLLLLLGIVVWLGQAFELDLGQVGWPFFVIVPGLALLGVGLAATGRLGEVLAMVGGLVTVAGLVLLLQNATDRFDTWAYAWTLVVLVGPGIGRCLVGVVRGRRDLAVSGVADRRRAGWLPGPGGVLRGRGRHRWSRQGVQRGGGPLRPGGAAGRGRPGSARSSAAHGQAAMRPCQVAVEPTASSQRDERLSAALACYPSAS